jgi:hypothetical protein
MQSDSASIEQIKLWSRFVENQSQRRIDFKISPRPQLASIGSVTFGRVPQIEFSSKQWIFFIAVKSIFAEGLIQKSTGVVNEYTDRAYDLAFAKFNAIIGRNGEANVDQEIFKLIELVIDSRLLDLASLVKAPEQAELSNCDNAKISAQVAAMKGKHPLEVSFALALLNR